MSAETSSLHFFPKATIFMVTFLALYIILIATIPSAFYYAGTVQGSEYDYSFLSMEDIQHIKHLESVNLTRPALSINYKWFDFNPEANFKMRVAWTAPIGVIGNLIYFEHCTWEFLWIQTFDQMQIENIAKTYFGSPPIYWHYFLTKEYAVAQWNENYNATILHPVQCDHITTKVWLFDANTTRNNISQAWDDGAINIAMGFGFSDYETKVSAMDILGRLLLFQAPTIFGLTGDMATIVNLILTVPFYTCVALLIFLAVLMVVPF